LPQATTRLIDPRTPRAVRSSRFTHRARLSLRPSRASSHTNGGMRRRAAGMFHKCVTAPQQLEQRGRPQRTFSAKMPRKRAKPLHQKGLRRSQAFRKNRGNSAKILQQTNQRVCYEALTSNYSTPQIPESLGSRCAPSGNARPDHGIPEQILMESRVISDTGIHHNNNHRAQAIKGPEKSNKVFVSKRLYRVGERGKWADQEVRPYERDRDTGRTVSSATSWYSREPTPHPAPPHRAHKGGRGQGLAPSNVVVIPLIFRRVARTNERALGIIAAGRPRKQDLRRGKQTLKRKRHVKEGNCRSRRQKT
jgi:hypothetical protein